MTVGGLTLTCSPEPSQPDTASGVGRAKDESGERAGSSELLVWRSISSGSYLNRRLPMTWAEAVYYCTRSPHVCHELVLDLTTTTLITYRTHDGTLVTYRGTRLAPAQVVPARRADTGRRVW